MSVESTSNQCSNNYICRPQKKRVMDKDFSAPAKSKVEVKGDLRTKLETKGIRKYLCRQLREARLKKRLSQMDLAFLIGSDQRYISLIENGDVNPSLDKLIAISRHLDCFIQFKEKELHEEL